VDQHGLTGLDLVAATDQELGGHALQQDGRGGFQADRIGDLDRAIGRDHGGLGIGAERAVIGDAVSGLEPGDAFAQRLDDARRLQSEYTGIFIG
jgi:hypothetical protein